MSVRGAVAVGALRWSYRLETGLAALVDADSLRALNREAYQSQVEEWSRRAADGLEPPEEEALARAGIRVGRALCLGCGGGREALALARRGLEVTGVDQVPGLLASARARAAEAGVPARFVEGDLSAPDFGGGPYELVTLLNLAYSHVPTRRLRARLLARCRALLAPGGRCVVSFAAKAPGPTERRWFPALKALAFLTGNPGYELGDRIDATPTYFRLFPSPEVVAAEAREAGFSEASLLAPTPFDHFAVLAP